MSANKILVYTGEGFTGVCGEFSQDVAVLKDHGLDKVISSLKVIGAPWVGCYLPNFEGKTRLFEEGEYPTLEDKKQFSSLRKITQNLENPEIQLFEDTYWQGRSVTLKEETNLQNIDFNDTASSHKVKSGVWVLYQHCDRGGNQMVCFPGEQIDDYIVHGFNDVMSHARPLLPKK
ncbi:epidermal differentiation-specific protein-like [Misgurnus anguillicaudatus]|uniref:epidermal differentiation-specific protein-like n=1 Tax=Misgurnus anguillicaudatus TaxID=75329 RepID=UPI003CCF5D5D